MSEKDELVVDDFYDSDDEHPQDLKGCLYFAFRMTGCMLWLYITMFVAIILAAIVSLVFYR